MLGFKHCFVSFFYSANLLFFPRDYSCLTSQSCFEDQMIIIHMKDKRKQSYHCLGVLYCFYSVVTSLLWKGKFPKGLALKGNKTSGEIRGHGEIKEGGCSLLIPRNQFPCFFLIPEGRPICRTGKVAAVVVGSTALDYGLCWPVSASLLLMSICAKIILKYFLFIITGLMYL